MFKKSRKWLLALILGLSLALSACVSDRDTLTDQGENYIGVEGIEGFDQIQNTITEDGTYTSKEEVASYLYLYEKLPENYINKSKARDLGWDSSQGNLWEVAPGKSIGGDRFGNREGTLPKKEGRSYYECDIDYEGGFRNAKRIVFSDDLLIFYTEDHYETFEQLYGEKE